MCQDCGCIETESLKIEKTVRRSQPSEHSEKLPNASHKISIKEQILNKNNQLAQHNRRHFEKYKLFCMNWLSAPGSGKTTLLERIIHDLKHELSIAVIEGDQQTDQDAQRIAATGIPVVQINTGAGCHLDAAMIHKAAHQLNLEGVQLLVIENIGNMVCPTAYDLGEHLKLSIISCPEGDDKPIKYPDLLLSSSVLLINKTDLLPYLNFDLNRCITFAKKINPQISIFPVSAQTGSGMETFYSWLKFQIGIPARGPETRV
ncbi:hydrogenase nickel incorporation protein HypB [Deltaproteobacteria bacterium TL4]